MKAFSSPNPANPGTIRHESRWLLAPTTAVLLGAPALIACTSAEETASQAALQITTYQGRDLRCRVTDGSYDKPAYDCDFTGFYADPTYTAPSALPRIDKDKFKEVEVPYLNGVLRCLVFDQDHDTFAETCDYPRFYAETNTSQ